VAENSDGATKSEEASPRKLEEARKKGDVAKSHDLPSWMSLCAAAAVLSIVGGRMAADMANQLQPFIAHPDAFNLEGGAAGEVMRRAAYSAVPLMASVMGAAALAGVAGNVVQHGFLFTTERLMPDPSRLSPAEGFKRLFGVDGLVNFVKSLLKIFLVGFVAYLTLKPHIHDFQLMSTIDLAGLLPLSVDMLRGLFFSVLALLGVGAGADWLWQRYRFMERMKMTKEEQKEDFRQSEGDPHIKARLRQLRIERSRRRMMQNVPKATVVVMNPTHFAVALRYQSGETAAPLCLAKGIDSLALKIREVAEANNVPIVEDAPLARALYATVEIDQTIPREHYEAVAKVIGFVMRQAKKRRWQG
jgi:flagellar biosynthesis protein FlhB